MIPFLDEGRVRACLSYDELIPAMEQALIDFSSGRTTQPVRTIMPVPDHSGFFSIMPARYGNVMGAKLVTFYENDARHQLPTHLATIHLLAQPRVNRSPSWTGA